MTDSRGITRKGHWLKFADDYLAEWEGLSARVPAVEQRILTARLVQATANDEVALPCPAEAGVIVAARFSKDGAGVFGQYYLVSSGVSATVPSTLAALTTSGGTAAGGTAVALKPNALVVATTCNFAALAALSWKRVTTGGNGTLLASAVEIEYAPDITSQLANIGNVNAAVRITRATFTPDTTYTAGASYLVNTGAGGTAASTVATLAGAALTGGVPYTLTLDTTYDDITARQWLAFRRLTASGDKTMPGGKVDIEYVTSYAETD